MADAVEMLDLPSGDLQLKEQLYLALRRREGRVWSDQELLRLPDIPSSHPLSAEWRWRKRSCSMLLGYLKRRFPGNAQVLDLGCGNGWMAHLLAAQVNWQVLATDVNLEELEQGARVFSRSTLQFMYVDVEQNIHFKDRYAGQLDAIVLAASVQYFPDLERIIGLLRQLLKPGGEIHCIDSPFYRNETEIAAARRRSADYFSRMGAPDMSNWYFHHSLEQAKRLGAVNLLGLGGLLLQKTGYLSPFPWMRFRKEL